MGCGLTCSWIKKSMDACKANDYKKALSILIKAKDLPCEDVKLQRAIDLAIGELIEEDYEAVMWILRDTLMYCEQLKE